MIHSTFNDHFDWRKAVPDGEPVGIVACADCAAACGVSDTERVEAVSAILAPRCRVVFSGSLEAPCDARAFKLFSRAVDGFAECRTLVVLACEAGSRAIGDLAKREGLPLRVVSPVRTLGFVFMRSGSRAVPACVFCRECDFPEKDGPCPVALCPERARARCAEFVAGRPCPRDGTLDCPFPPGGAAPAPRDAR